MSDLWTAEHDDALLDAWRSEVERALGGCGTEMRVVLIEGVVRARVALLDVDALARFAEHPDAPIFRELAAQAVVRMARWLRRLGLSRRDVHRLDLGRRRRAGKGGINDG